MALNNLAKQIDELTERLEALKQKAFPPAARERVANGICLSCGDPLNETGTRGCHSNCYRTIKRDIDAGRYTEGKAITHGLLSPEQKSGRRSAATGGRAALLAESSSEIDAEADQMFSAVAEEGDRDLKRAVARDQAEELKTGSKKRPTKKKAE